MTYTRTSNKNYSISGDSLRNLRAATGPGYSVGVTGKVLRMALMKH